MRKRFTLSLISWLASYVFALAQPAKDAQLATQFDKLLANQFKANGPGCSALVARNGKVIYQKAFGMANLELNVPMQTNMIFRIGSITKQFTAIAILQLMEQGKLFLQDEITRFIPDYPTQGKRITIEHLLTHTSGIKDYTNVKGADALASKDVTPTELIDFFKNQPMEFEPGSQWQYNNSGYFLLGYIIEKVSGKTYPQYLQETFFKPLGMSHSYYGSNSELIINRAAGYQAGKGDEVQNADYLSMSYPYAAGSILSSVGDLWKWQQAVQGHKLVKKETLDKAWSPYKLSNGQLTEYGYGWGIMRLEGSLDIEHGGSINGFMTDALYVPKEDVFVTVFSNSTANSPEGIAGLMALIAMGKDQPYREMVVSPTALSEYVGVYENESGQQRIITLTDNQLYSQLRGSGKRKLKPSQKDRFFFENTADILGFVRDSRGQLTSTDYVTRRFTTHWQKTTKPLLQAN